MGAVASFSKETTSLWLGLSEWALLVFALVVVVGLIGEHKLPTWHIRYKIFEILVAVGCGGEMVADGGIFLFSSHLQTLSDLEVADARTESAGAMERASKADERSKTLENANLTLQAEVLTLQQAAAPRRLSEIQKSDLLERLSKVTPFRVGFSIPASNGTGESFDLTDDLVDVFTRMKLLPQNRPKTGRGTTGLNPSNVHGVIIGAKDRLMPPPAARVLADFLTKLAMEVSISQPDGTGLVIAPDELLIVVGNKQ